MKRYHSFNYIYTLEIDEALSLVEYAITQQEEELLFQRWVHDLQFQMSFEEFKSSLKPAAAEIKPQKVEDILEEVRVITTLL